jgi:hypothetical protein
MVLCARRHSSQCGTTVPTCLRMKPEYLMSISAASASTGDTSPPLPCATSSLRHDHLPSHDHSDTTTTNSVECA